MPCGLVRALLHALVVLWGPLLGQPDSSPIKPVIKQIHTCQTMMPIVMPMGNVSVEDCNGPCTRDTCRACCWSSWNCTLITEHIYVEMHKLVKYCHARKKKYV